MLFRVHLFAPFIQGVFKVVTKKTLFAFSVAYKEEAFQGVKVKKSLITIQSIAL
jgi:hypothetical protein